MSIRLNLPPDSPSRQTPFPPDGSTITINSRWAEAVTLPVPNLDESLRTSPVLTKLAKKYSFAKLSESEKSELKRYCDYFDTFIQKVMGHIGSRNCCETIAKGKVFPNNPAFELWKSHFWDAYTAQPTYDKNWQITYLFQYESMYDYLSKSSEAQASQPQKSFLEKICETFSNFICSLFSFLSTE